MLRAVLRFPLPRSAGGTLRGLSSVGLGRQAASARSKVERAPFVLEGASVAEIYEQIAAAKGASPGSLPGKVRIVRRRWRRRLPTPPRARALTHAHTHTPHTRSLTRSLAHTRSRRPCRPSSARSAAR